MDTGMSYKPLSEELDNCPDITVPDQLSKFIDLVVSREASWLHGSILVQNLLSCVYIEDFVTHKLEYGREIAFIDAIKNYIEQTPLEKDDEKIWEKIMFAYLIGVVKTIGIILNKSKVQVVFADEDRADLDAQGNYLEHLDTKLVISFIETATKYVRNLKKAKLAGKEESAVKSLASLLDRLELRIEILYIYSERKQPKKSHVSRALELIKKIGEDPVESVQENMFDNCFTSGAQSRLLNFNPLKPMVKTSVIEGYETHENIITSIESYRAVTDLTNATEILSFFVSTCSSSKILAFSRTFLQVITRVTDTQILDKKFINWAKADISESVSPLLSKYFENGFKPENKILIDHLGVSYGCLLQATMVNRSRQRQLLAHCIIAWDTLQVFAEEFEDKVFQTQIAKEQQTETVTWDNGNTVPAFPISSWVMMRKVQIMMWVVFMGFELEIYKPWEFGYMYKYAATLANFQKSTLSAINRYTDQLSLVIARDRMKLNVPQGFKGTKQDYKKAILSDLQRCIRYTSGLTLESEVVEHICLANSDLVMAFILSGLITRPSAITAHTSPELLYGLRMKPFGSVGRPELPQYSALVEIDNKFDDVEAEIQKRLASVKTHSNITRAMIDRFGPSIVEANPEMKALKRSAVGINVSGGILSSFIKKGNTNEGKKTHSVNIESKEYHWFFPVPMLKASK